MKNGICVLKHLRNKRGITMVMTLIILALTTIYLTVVLAIYSNNFKLAKHQEHYMEVYYLAYSGVEMAFSALIADENDLFNDIKSGATTSLSEDDIPFEDGMIDVLVTKSNDANYNGWIKISSTATLNASKVSRTRTLLIDPSNQKNTVWKEN